MKIKNLFQNNDSSLQKASKSIRKKGILDHNNPEIGIILGTGLGKEFLKEMNIIFSIDYQNIHGFVSSTVEAHAGKLHYGTIFDKYVIVMEGRFHYYEGWNMDQIVFPVRVLKKLGIQYLLISNAAGCMNLKWKKSELMLLTDHINLLPLNPLRGQNNHSLGPRFPDMSCPYSPQLNALLLKIASEKKIILREGVYICISGPSLETKAEYRFLRMVGGDAVGMSTVPEVIASVHMNLPCCAISVLTDECDPDNLQPVAIQDIIQAAAKAEGKLTELYLGLIEQL